MAEDELPKHLGLCPIHGEEFYVPLDDPKQSLICPNCDRQLVVYTQLPRPIMSRDAD